jgi:DNA polymerase III alpha subunit (gram-positive type)
MIVFDLETSSLRPSSAEILTADFIYCDEKYNIFDKRSFRFKPRLWDADASEAVAIHGITKEEAFTYPAYNTEIRKMFDWLIRFEGENLVCHANRMFNSTYDAAILRFHALDNNYYFEFQKAFPENKYISSHSVGKYLELPCKLDLKSMCNYYSLGDFEHHSSAEDAMMCYNLMKKMDPDIKQFLEWEQMRKGKKYESTEDSVQRTRPSKIQQDSHGGFSRKLL